MRTGSVDFGRDELNSLSRILERYPTSNVLLVTGRASYNEQPLRCHFESLLDKHVVWRYDDFSVNPSLDDLQKGTKIVAELKPDLIIGIGGGSVLDTAKLIRILPNHTQQIEEIIKGMSPIKESKIKLILIPTTAGSGSEATHFAVSYIGKDKYSVASPFLVPDHVILDPALSDSMPSYLTAVTGADALAQAIESYWAVGATEESIDYAAESIIEILQHFEDVIHRPSKQARDKMMLASYLAGKAINITKTTAPHALSYGFTQNHGIPHGHAVMLTLPELLRLNTFTALEALSDKLSYREYPKRVKQLCKLFGKDEPEDVAQYLEVLLDHVGLKRRLRDFDIAFDDLPMLAKSVNTERLNNNPVQLTQRQLLEVLEKIY
ncbi:phosphonoacetaldehyde reductase [Olivibacter sp. SDN3]|uniref:phosphonoacetaldehyde reductase n=1 Tax=Olivibacter sp. SDN3 TaxID=2764720 RepID=UPI00165170E4|nr:phosphonoacetaldehyde reductase [Olivibacter sp. SDN3]QNL47742.1 phosphonoacetaldehyde reductase [Olivibacter sp. SDN3]